MSYLKSVIAPSAEFHFALLLVEWKPGIKRHASSSKAQKVPRHTTLRPSRTSNDTRLVAAKL